MQTVVFDLYELWLLNNTKNGKREVTGNRTALLKKIDYRASGVVDEVDFPLVGGERSDVALGVVGDPLQNVDEISVRVDAVHLAGDDESLKDAHVLRADFGPAKEPVLASHRTMWSRSFASTWPAES